MKKYLWFAPLALNYYISFLFMIITAVITALFPFDAIEKISAAVVYIWYIFGIVIYIISLIRLVTNDDYDAKSAATAALFVKIPQIPPTIIIFIGSLLMMIVPPIGIMLSFMIWIMLIGTSVATSIVVMTACIRMAKLGNLTTGKAILFSILGFLPIMEYIVPIILFALSKMNHSGTGLKGHS